MPAIRISELHKSAFWIYGVSAMIMHDPVAHVLSHLSAAGLGNWEVRLEIWRCFVLLALMARFFLALGIFFDEVYMRESSSSLFPRKSYPADFLAGLMHFMLFLAAAVTLASPVRFWGEIAGFALLALLIVLYDNLWYVVSAGFGFSTCATIRPLRNSSNLAFACSAAIYLAARLAAGKDPVFAEQAGFCVMLAFAICDVGRLIRKYERAEAAAAQVAGR